MGVYVGDNLVAGNVGEVYSKAQVDAMIANAVALAEPTGSIKPFAGTTIPDGYLLCDGSAVSRTTYAALFAVIGTTYGSGDGSTTFNLPNGKALVGNYFGLENNGQSIRINAPDFGYNNYTVTLVGNQTAVYQRNKLGVETGGANTPAGGSVITFSESGLKVNVSNGMKAIIRY